MSEKKSSNIDPVETAASSPFNSPIKHVMDLSELRMSRDATQQSIIWNEITASRRKLEEENQMLRDKLYEAQMANRLLRLKLKQSQTGANVNKDLKLLAKESTMFQKVFRTRKDTFRNPAAPGKKIFQVSKNYTAEVRSYNSGSDKTPPTMISVPVPVSPESKQETSRTRACNSVRRQPKTDSSTNVRHSNNHIRNGVTQLPLE